MKKVIINGFGRIGRCVLRILWERYDDIEVIQINEPNASIESIAYAIKYDSIYGSINSIVTIDQSEFIKLCSNGKVWKMEITSAYSPKFTYQENTTIIDSSNQCDVEKLCLDNQEFARILITKWSENATLTHLFDQKYMKRPVQNNIISCGICDTIGIVPVLSIFNIASIQSVSITTLHPFLNYQNLLDGYSRENINCDYNYQIGRSAINSVIPKRSSVKEILCEVFPLLKNKLSFMTYRIPTEAVTTCDMDLVFEDSISKNEIEELIKSNSNGVEYTYDNVVSRDYVNSVALASIDLNWLFVSENRVHLTFYYNNELGYAHSVCQII